MFSLNHCLTIIRLYTILEQQLVVARGYQTEQIKERLVDLLRKSKIGLSGVEISKRLEINRITMTKYLGIFAAQGLVNQKNIGNTTLWFIDDSIEQFNFPDDYYTVQKKYSEFLITFSHKQIFTLVRNCINSGASAPKMINEIMIPSISTINDLFDDGKIGTAEENLLRNIVSESIKILDVAIRHNDNSTKNVIVLSADSDSQLISDATSALYHDKNWTVFPLGDMASTADVLFDLDLQKLLSKIWKKKTGIMLIVVLSNSQEGLQFFADSINSIKQKLGKKLFLVLCGPVDTKTKLDADLVASDLDTVLQWSETVFESLYNNNSN